MTNTQPKRSSTTAAPSGHSRGRRPAPPSEPILPAPCLVCGEQLNPVPADPRTPFRGIVFTSPGNYGSRVFDSLDEVTRLHIVICDRCLITGSKAGRILLVHRLVTTSETAAPWNATDH